MKGDGNNNNTTIVALARIRNCDRIIHSTLQRIIDAKGCYILMTVHRRHENGVRASPAALEAFGNRFAEVATGTCKAPLDLDRTEQHDQPHELAQVAVEGGEV